MRRYLRNLSTECGKTGWSGETLENRSINKMVKPYG